MTRSNPATAQPAEARLGHLIKRCEQALIAEKSRVLKEHQLSVPQYVAMLTLSESPNISGTQLARRCHVTAQAMASLLALLEERGLITRTHSDVHAKVLLVRLTRSGQSVLRRADRAALGVERRLSAAFTEQELAALRGYLNTAIAALATPVADAG